MSYHFVVKVVDGKPAVDEESVAAGTVPDGVFSISGHEGNGYVSIGITRAEHEGPYQQVIVQATGQAKHRQVFVQATGQAKQG